LTRLSRMKQKKVNCLKEICVLFFAAIVFTVIFSYGADTAFAQNMVMTDNLFLNMVKFFAKNGDIERALVELKRLQQIAPNNPEYRKYEELLRTEFNRGGAAAVRAAIEPPRETAAPKQSSAGEASVKKQFQKNPPSVVTDDSDLPPGVAEKNAEIARGRLRYVYELIARGDEIQAMMKLREILNAEPRYYEAATLLGDLYLAKKNYAEALTFYKKALEARRDPELNYKTGLCYKNTGDQDNAIIHFDIAIRMNPRHELANLNLGNIWRFRKNFKIARGYYEQALKSNMKLVEAHLGMADCFYNEGNADEAASTYAYIITNFPTEYSAYLGLSRILIGNGQFNEAKAVITKAKELAPNASQVYEMSGFLAYKAKDVKGAVENYRRAISLDPNSQTAYESLVNIFVDDKKFEDALEIIKSTQKKFPGNARLYYMAGIIYSGFKNDNLALKNLLEAYKLDSGNFEIVLALALLYENGFKYREAIEKYREALLLLNEKKDTRFLGTIQDKIDILEKKIEKYSQGK